MKEPKAQSKTPCDKCVGKACGCTFMAKRNHSEECKAFAEIGKNVIEFKDGSKQIF